MNSTPDDRLASKSADLLELKAHETPGEFTAVISAIGNVDREGDRVMPGAFDEAIKNDPVPPVFWSHKHDIPPIGEGLDWKEVGNEVHYTGRLFVKGDTAHPWAEMVYAGMKSHDGRKPAIQQFSYTYGVPEGGEERVTEDGKSIRNLHQIRPVVEVGPTFIGMNPETRLVAAAKAYFSGTASPDAVITMANGTTWTNDDGGTINLELAEAIARSPEFAEYDFFQLTEKAEWSAEYVNSLPDSSFLYIESGGANDDGGKTAPRSLRHFPYKDANGKIAMPHLRNAIKQAPEATAIPEEDRASVQKKAQRLLRAQEGKALLLGTIYSAKAWDDIQGYAIQTLLGMLDAAVSYIQSEADAADVETMKGIAASLISLMTKDFRDASNATSAAKSALAMAVDLYQAAAEVEMPSDSDPNVINQEIARLLSARPTH